MRPDVPLGQGNEGPHLSLVVSFLCGYPDDEEGSHDVATLWGQVPIQDLLSFVQLPQCCGRWHLRPLPAPWSHRGAHGGITLSSLSWPRFCCGDSSLVFAHDSAL